MASNVAYDNAHEKVLFDPGEASNCQFSSMRVRDIPRKRSFDAFGIIALSVIVNCVVIGVFSYLLINKRVENLFAKEIGLQNRTDVLTEMKQLELSPCGSWKPYKDEKCFKVINQVMAFADAEQLCRQADSVLLTIGLLDEQTFVKNLIFTQHSVVDALWLEANDGQYSNWASDSAHNGSDTCTQMIAIGSRQGMWINVPCNKKNLVVCQKEQPWSKAHFQQAYIKTRKELETLKLNDASVNEQLITDLNELKLAKIKLTSEVEVLKETQSVAQNQLEKLQISLKNDSIPIGFIYVQLPKEKSPEEIWPLMTWTDVSSTYAGVFFRVEGGNAATFGDVQSDNAPRLTMIKYDDSFSANLVKPFTKTKLGDWSDSVSTGGNNQGESSHSYLMSSGEVRPVNMAMRVWKRTG